MRASTSTGRGTPKSGQRGATARPCHGTGTASGAATAGSNRHAPKLVELDAATVDALVLPEGARVSVRVLVDPATRMVVQASVRRGEPPVDHSTETPRRRARLAARRSRPDAAGDLAHPAP